MLKGLNAFVEGRSTMDALEAEEKLEFDMLLHRYHSLGPTTTPHSASISHLVNPASPQIVTKSHDTSPAAPHSVRSPYIMESHANDEPHFAQNNSVSRMSTSVSLTSEDSLSGYTAPQGDPTAIDEDHSHKLDQSIEAERTKVFQRAATLLRQSLDLKDHGGVLFLDTCKFRVPSELVSVCLTL